MMSGREHEVMYKDVFNDELISVKHKWSTKTCLRTRFMVIGQKGKPQNKLKSNCRVYYCTCLLI